MKNITLMFITFILSYGACFANFEENNNSLSMDEARPFIVNSETISEIELLPIIFKEEIYLPLEYISFFNEKELELALYLVKGTTDLGLEVFYAFSNKAELVNYRLKQEEEMSVSSNLEPEFIRTRSRRSSSQCYYRKGWYIWWEWRGVYWMPHYVITFDKRPSSYTGWIKSFSLLGGWKKVAADPYTGDSKGVLMQKRDLLLLCNGTPGGCWNIAICG